MNSPHKLRMWQGEQAKVAVIGAGAFGLALSKSAEVGGCEVTVFARKADFEKAQQGSIDATQGIKGSGDQRKWQAMETYSNTSGTLNDFHLVVLAIPCQALRNVCQWVKAHASESTQPLYVLSAAKGIEIGTCKLPSEVMRETLQPSAAIGTLSGPSFAKELNAGLPTSVVVASSNDELTARAEHLLHRSFFRVYRSKDIVGVEVGGALKNVIAMVAGAVDGLGLGNNARAAVVTRGLQEIAQVGVKLGANPLTFLGLSGLGDLILTCTGDLSRNRQFGMRLAQGEDPNEVIKSLGQVVEGVTTAQSAHELSLKLGLDTPILDVAHQVIFCKKPIREAVSQLLSRSNKGEFDWINT